MIDQVRPAQLAAWITDQSGGESPAVAPAVVLDVRESWELETASVRSEGFELMKIPMGDIPARLAELNPEQPVAVLCHHGNRSQRVAMFLAQQGFSKLANIAGGIEAWSEEIDGSVPRY